MNISVNYFTKAQIKLLSNNQYVVKITKKRLLIRKNLKTFSFVNMKKDCFHNSYLKICFPLWSVGEKKS